MVRAQIAFRAIRACLPTHERETRHAAVACICNLLRAVVSGVGACDSFLQDDSRNLALLAAFRIIEYPCSE